MRLGIRAKLVMLLVVAALVPLVGALGVILVGGYRYRVDTYGNLMESRVFSEAMLRQVSLAKDVVKFEVAMQDEQMLSLLERHDTLLPAQELQKLDAEWPNMPPTAPAMAAVMQNPIAKTLRQIKESDPNIALIMVTDRFGQLVAATDRIANFFQPDEAWWKGAYNDGHGKVFIPPEAMDEDIRVWSVSLCIPIFREGKFLGVVKAVLDLSRWVDGASNRMGLASANLTLVRRGDGMIIFGQGLTPMTVHMKDWRGPIATSPDPGWRLAEEGAEIQGFAPIQLPPTIGLYPVEMPSWELVLDIPTSQALGAGYRLTYQVLAIGVVIIAAVFFGGLLLAERSIVRRLRRMEQATRQVAEGDLTHRIAAGWAGQRLLGTDEIDDLSRDFNHMVDRVQASHDALQSANQMKLDFIKVASHELRTPISYILGMGRLLRDSQDATRLQFALQTIVTKAKRLDDIIQMMFKLMPEHRYREEMHYRTVDLRQMMEEIYLDAFPFVEKRNQRLILDAPEGLPPIEADPGKLRDVIENLVMNAIKFTPDHGTIKVRVAVELNEALSISVQDQGAGIPEADLPHIFEPFFSGADILRHSSGASEFGKRGMGLGLAIVKRFVDLHGGTVVISSTPKGTTFTVTIPRRPAGGPDT